MSSDSSISNLIDLFRSIGVKEKGIEKIYDYLLRHETIDDLKIIEEKMDLSLKRIYKVIQVLDNYNLIQVYSRPMKIILNDPISVWETIISEKIKEIRTEANQQIELCESSFNQMSESYRLHKDSANLPPVGFIDISSHNDTIPYIADEVLGSFKTMILAKGLKFDSKFGENLLQIIRRSPKRPISEKFSPDPAIADIVTKISREKIQILLSKDYFLETAQILEELPNYHQVVRPMIPQTLPRLEIKVTDSSIGNFIVKDASELLQFSIAPNNMLLGLFISRQIEIIQVFQNKFHEEFATATSFADYYSAKLNKPCTPMDEILFTLL